MTTRRPGTGAIIRGKMAATLGIDDSPQGVGNAFVGRARELQAFSLAFDGMLDGRRQILTLAGEPGIGKTRLAEALAESVEDRGALVLWGRCYEEPGAPPYWPWVQILRELVEALSPSELSRLAGSGGAEIAALVPELGVALGAETRRPQARHEPPLDPSRPRQDPPLEPSQARFRTFDAISGLFRRAAAQVPLVVLIDNAHWADKASLSLLEFLCQELVRSRLVVVVTYRDTEISRNNPLLATLGVLSGGEGVERLKLRGLDSEDIAALAGRLLGKPLSDAVVDEIDRQTDGNPLFVIELLKVLIEESRDAGAASIAVRIPDGVRETIGRRLSRLPDGVNNLLRAAAVVGRSFEAAVLARVADTAIETVVAALDLAERAGFVEAPARIGQTYRFTHALIRETLYDELATRERLELHGLAGDALVMLHPDEGHSPLSRIAHHYFEASALGDVGQAIDYALAAGREAMRLDACDEATVHYGNAIRLLRQSAAGDIHRLREAILCQVGALTGTADLGRISALVAESIEDRELADDEVWLTDLFIQWIVVTSDGIQVEQLPLLRRILERLPQGDNAARAKVLAAQAFAERTLGNVIRVESLVRESIAMARRLGDMSVLSHCLRSSMLALGGDPARIGIRLALGEAFIGVTPSDGTNGNLVEALYQQTCNLIEAGRIDAAERLAVRLTTLEGARFGFQEYRTEALHLVLAFLRGEYGGLAERIEALRRTGHKTRGEDAEGVYGVQMFMLHRDLGRLQGLAPVIERFSESPLNRAWTPGLMLALTEIGRLDAARREFEKLAADDFTVIPFDDMRVATLVYCTETCAELGDADRARQLYAVLEPYAATFAWHPLAVCFGSIERFLGLLAGMIGETGRAVRHFEAAIDANRAARAWPALARSLFELGRLEQRSESKAGAARAEPLLREAEQLAGTLGMESLVAAIGAQLRGRAARADYPDELTAREVDVLQLIAIGRSNKDIANVLSISLNTVATHVRNILIKTDCANRTEAAAYARRSGIVQSS